MESSSKNLNSSNGSGRLFLTAMSMLGGYNQAAAQSLNSESQSFEYRLNQTRTDLAYADTLRAYDDQKNMGSNKRTETLSKLNTASGSTLVDTRSGTSGQLRNDVNLYAEMDKATVEINAFKAAWGIETGKIASRYNEKTRKIEDRLKREQSIAEYGYKAANAYYDYKGSK